MHTPRAAWGCPAALLWVRALGQVKCNVAIPIAGPPTREAVALLTSGLTASIALEQVGIAPTFVDAAVAIHPPGNGLQLSQAESNDVLLPSFALPLQALVPGGLSCRISSGYALTAAFSLSRQPGWAPTRQSW